MLTQLQKEQFDLQGYLILDQLFSSQQMDELQNAAAQIVNKFDADSTRSVFSTQDQSKSRDNYFLSSGDKVRCFFEEDAFDADGQLRQQKSLSINKIGHALHVLEPVFKEFSESHTIRQLALDIGMQKPQIHQSMYIFKQPKIGGVIRWHQDASYFYTNPISVITFWFAVEDATVQNGCIQIQDNPQSYPLIEQFKRYENDETELVKLSDKPWPNNDEARPLEVKKGSVIIFNGLLPHFSAANLSGKSRHAYTLHMTCGTTKYAKENWLQAKPSPLY
jgi:phytanoyl-CoA hydroxylase